MDKRNNTSVERKCMTQLLRGIPAESRLDDNSVGSAPYRAGSWDDTYLPSLNPIQNKLWTKAKRVLCWQNSRVKVKEISEKQIMFIIIIIIMTDNSHIFYLAFIKH